MQPKRAPITVAHTIQPHRAGPWIWCSAPNRIDTTPAKTMLPTPPYPRSREATTISITPVATAHPAMMA